MRLSETQILDLMRSHGVYVTEACDRCGHVLGFMRYTHQGKKGIWCSQSCRDGFKHKGGTCGGCGVSLKGMRRHAQFCSGTCRKRLRARDRKINAETRIANKGLTSAISRFAYPNLATFRLVLQNREQRLGFS